MMSVATAIAAAQSSDPAPTVGEIVIDSYDCDTGLLNFHVPVTDLPYLDAFDGAASLAFEYNAHYEQGPDFSIPVESFNPQAEIAPYTGDVYLDSSVPPTNPDEPSNSRVTSIDLRVSVGNGTDGDTSRTTFTPDCGDGDTSLDELIRQIIALLEQILGDL